MNANIQNLIESFVLDYGGQRISSDTLENILTSVANTVENQQPSNDMLRLIAEYILESREGANFVLTLLEAKDIIDSSLLLEHIDLFIAAAKKGIAVEFRYEK